jgi:hypothetical protein
MQSGGSSDSPKNRGSMLLPLPDTLFIIAGGGPPAFTGIAGHEPDLAVARNDARAIKAATEALLRVAPCAGSYLAESDYSDPNCKQSCWGVNFDRLATVKKRYDPDGLFFAHHGVGSDEGSADGFTRLWSSSSRALVSDWSIRECRTPA